MIVKKILLLWALFTGMATGVSIGVSMADTIIIVADAWPPYNGIPGSPEPGYGIEVARIIFEKHGHQVVYRLEPWNRAVLETRSGKFTAVIGANIEDAPDFIFPEEEFGVSRRDFWVLADSPWRFTGERSLLAVRIGAIKGYSYGENMDRFFRDHPRRVEYVFGADPLGQNIQKLLRERIDTTIENRNVFLQKIKKMGLRDRIISAGSSGSVDNLYIAFSPNNDRSGQYAALFTEGIRRLKENGELDAILSRYGLEYWK